MNSLNKGACLIANYLKKLLFFAITVTTTYGAEECKEFDSLVQSAEQGNVVAQHQLGVARQFGRCIEKDDNEAIYWYFLSASNGSIDALYSIGLQFKLGFALPRNERVANLYFSRAASQGHQLSVVQLVNSRITNFSDCESLSEVDNLLSSLSEPSAIELVEKSHLNQLRKACSKNDSERAE